MASFRDLHFTTQDFAKIHDVDSSLITQLESEGWLNVVRKRVGNVDRKFLSLEDMQEFFKKVRRGDQSQQASGALSESSTLEEQMAAETLNTQAQTLDNANTSAADSLMTQPADAPSSTHYDVLKILPHSFLEKPRQKVMMFYNIKGGTGKSTLTAQFAMRASMLGFKVLAIDLDGQGHLTLNLDLLDAHERPTIYDILINDVPIEQAIVNVAPGLDLLPANLGLCNIEIPLNMKPRREYRLSEALDRVKDQYDLIIADTNPAASLLNSSMLVATEAVNVVCATNPLAFHGMSLVMSTLQEMEREFRKNLVINIIPNMYDNREVISQEVLGELRAQFPEYCMDAVINRSADINEATKRRTTVLDVNARGTASRDVNKMTLELLFRNRTQTQAPELSQ